MKIYIGNYSNTPLLENGIHVLTITGVKYICNRSYLELLIESDYGHYKIKVENSIKKLVLRKILSSDYEVDESNLIERLIGVDLHIKIKNQEYQLLTPEIQPNYNTLLYKNEDPHSFNNFPVLNTLPEGIHKVKIGFCEERYVPVLDTSTFTKYVGVLFYNSNGIHYHKFHLWEFKKLEYLSKQESDSGIYEAIDYTYVRNKLTNELLIDEVATNFSRKVFKKFLNDIKLKIPIDSFVDPEEIVLGSNYFHPSEIEYINVDLCHILDSSVEIFISKGSNYYYNMQWLFHKLLGYTNFQYLPDDRLLGEFAFSRTFICTNPKSF